MKANDLLYAGLLTAGLATIGIAGENDRIKSKLDEATIYFQGAELTHSAVSNLTKGDNELTIESLCPNIDKNSLKIKISNGVLVSSFEYSIDYLSSDKEVETSLKKLLDSVETYQKLLDKINTDIKINTEMILYLQKSMDKNISTTEKRINIDEFSKTIDYYQKKYNEIETTLTSDNKKKLEYSEIIKRLNNHIQQESKKNIKNSGILKLTLNSPLAAKANISISYYTPSASWIPYYDISIESTDKPIKIIGKSKVRQVTGLDWEKVKLTLSTAIPSNGKIAPLFNAWFLSQQISYNNSNKVPDFISAQNSYSYDQGPVFDKKMMTVDYSKEINNTEPLYIVDGAVVNSEYYNSIDKNMIKSSDFMSGNQAIDTYGEFGAGGVYIIILKNKMDDYIKQSENALNMVYNIDLPYTIPGNGKEQSIYLLTKEIDASFKYYCAPKLNSETYLLAEISDWEKLNLLSGMANITYDGNYIGETFINANSTSEKLSLTLGTDKRISVKREMMKDFSSTKFLGNDIKQTFVYKITVKNNQNKAVKMVLKDQYPLSTQKGISVDLLLKETTNPTFNKEDLGVITWEEELKAGETKTYQISYSVKYPKGSNLNL